MCEIGSENSVEHKQSQSTPLEANEYNIRNKNKMHANNILVLEYI